MFGPFGILVAIFLLILGILLITGILDFVLRILGVVCLIVGIVVGAMAIFGKKNRY